MTREKMKGLTSVAAGAQAIHTAFDRFHREFQRITSRAKGRFEQRDWHGAHRDALERLDLYGLSIDRIMARLKIILGDDLKTHTVWAEMKKAYSGLIAGRPELEIAETFFNSITRRVFATAGVDPDIEYVASDFDPQPGASAGRAYRTYRRTGTTYDLVREILLDYHFAVGYNDLNRDAQLVADSMDAHVNAIWESPQIDAVEVVHSVFYRHEAAYLVGRIRRGSRIRPLVLSLLNTEQGIIVDAALMTEDEVSIVFSFTRSYFHIEVETPYALIDFLKSIMPLKPLAELYIAIGYNKHGKTELYRDLRRHLESSEDKFEIARGDRGMVMVVFTIPSYDMVFKIIKDRFSYPKTATRQEVISKYQLVFKHDRAGRLVDAQEFEHLRFDRNRISEPLWAELQETAAGSVAREGDSVIIKHLYMERRLTPLNLYLKEAPAPGRMDAVIDYGQAVKDLAATNIFPGDLLLKNFGVTRHGRVVFYDYDELCLLIECNFRSLPAARDLDEELQAEPWFFVGTHDIFPEEFLKFLGLHGALREAFLCNHGDLLGVDFWINLQKRIRGGEIIETFPYRQSQRFVRP